MDLWKVEKDGSRTLIQVDLKETKTKEEDFANSVIEENAISLLQSWDRMMEIFSSLYSAREYIEDFSGSYEDFLGQFYSDNFIDYMEDELHELTVAIDDMVSVMPDKSDSYGCCDDCDETKCSEDYFLSFLELLMSELK